MIAVTDTSIEDMLSRACAQLLGRAGGPLNFRFILQPAVAVCIAIRAGLKDAKANRPAYLSSLLDGSGQRRALLSAGWKDIGAVFAGAVVLDTVYQVAVYHWFYPLQALIVAFTLAFIPYAVVRGPVSRIASRRRRTTLQPEKRPSGRARSST
jgi:hypothetical protein